MEAQNQALMSKIAELEALAEKKQEKAPVATEASRVEALLEQMVTRVSGLETKLQNSEPNKIPDKALPPSSATNGNKANEDDDDESDSEDDGFITTPSGQRVPPTSFSIYIPFIYIYMIFERPLNPTIHMHKDLGHCRPGDLFYSYILYH